MDFLRGERKPGPCQAPGSPEGFRFYYRGPFTTAPAKPTLPPLPQQALRWPRDKRVLLAPGHAAYLFWGLRQLVSVEVGFPG